MITLKFAVFIGTFIALAIVDKYGRYYRKRYNYRKILKGVGA